MIPIFQNYPTVFCFLNLRYCDKIHSLKINKETVWENHLIFEWDG